MSNEAAKPSSTPVSELGEFGLINHLTKDIRIRNESSIKGIGDDAAVLDYGSKKTLVSTDLLIEGIHFDLMYVPLKHLGYKSVVVNLSDIFAMNGIPKQITVSMAISSRFTVEALDAFYDGIETACRFYGVDLVGGDTTSSNKGMLISVTALGEAEEQQIAYRSGAQEGDLVCVSGDLGAAYLGLQILEREKQIYMEHPDVQPELKDHQYLIMRQLKPEARKDIVELFHQFGVVPSSMIDISDGLSSDLIHLCRESKVGAHIYEESLPIDDGTKQQAIDFNISPTTCILNGGEDYELLFTINPKDYEKIEDLKDIKVIGNILPEASGVKLFTPDNQEHDLVAQGWNALDQNQ